VGNAATIETEKKVVVEPMRCTWWRVVTGCHHRVGWRISVDGGGGAKGRC
jgi:hypothetical protein